MAEFALESSEFSSGPSLCEVDVIDNGSFAEQALEQKRAFEDSV